MIGTQVQTASNISNRGAAILSAASQNINTSSSRKCLPAQTPSLWLLHITCPHIRATMSSIAHAACSLQWDLYLLRLLQLLLVPQVLLAEQPPKLQDSYANTAQHGPTTAYLHALRCIVQCASTRPGHLIAPSVVPQTFCEASESPHMHPLPCAS